MPRSMSLTKVESVYQIGKRIEKTTAEGHTRRGTSIVDGLNPRQCPTNHGYFELSVEQLLSVLIEPARFDEERGELAGYQRGLITQRSREVARKLLSGKKTHPPLLASDGNNVYCVDGKHRIFGAVMARRPMWCVIDPMVEEKRAELYSDQSLATQISRDNLIFSKQNPLADYVRAAVIAKEKGDNHPWRSLIDQRATPDAISLGLAYAIIGGFCMGIVSSGSNRLAKAQDDVIKRSFKKSDGDTLASLIWAFGTKKTNPLAFSSPNLHAIVDVAVLVSRQQGMSKENIARWIKIMPQFNFADYSYARRSKEMRHFLVKHWNKRLKPENKITEDE